MSGSLVVCVSSFSLSPRRRCGEPDTRTALSAVVLVTSCLYVTQRKQTNAQNILSSPQEPRQRTRGSVKSNPYPNPRGSATGLDIVNPRVTIKIQTSVPQGQRPRPDALMGLAALGVALRPSSVEGGVTPPQGQQKLKPFSGWCRPLQRAKAAKHGQARWRAWPVLWLERTLHTALSPFLLRSRAATFVPAWRGGVERAPIRTTSPSKEVTLAMIREPITHTHPSRPPRVPLPSHISLTFARPLLVLPFFSSQIQRRPLRDFQPSVLPSSWSPPKPPHIIS